MKNDLMLNLDKLHTTDMGIDRIKRNLQVDVDDVVRYCHDMIVREDAVIGRKGKNWYVYTNQAKITINAHSYTIITAHMDKK